MTAFVNHEKRDSVVIDNGDSGSIDITKKELAMMRAVMTYVDTGLQELMRQVVQRIDHIGGNHDR